MTGVDAIIIYLVALGFIGLAPVAWDLFVVNRPSKWVPKQEWNIHTPLQKHIIQPQEEVHDWDELENIVNEKEENKNQHELLVTSDIPVFSADTISSQEPLHSIPTEDMMQNVNMLLDKITTPIVEDTTFSLHSESDMQPEMTIPDNNYFHFEEENISNSLLPINEYNMIEKKYGSEVANMITATPNFTQVEGFVTMIGKISEKNDQYFLEFNSERLRLIGNLPNYKGDIHIGEVFLVNGHYIDFETFNIESWVDPEMIQYGYEDNSNSRVM
ncbi:hypothetical protein [Metabacillus fastidiosus]|uniref:Uncharacterized protein n=1 Tax=Metabacillus fastidiosus TaxID=1458 RepID=A0ABU6NYA8_9BACI|nr:hypothetical protein [Metabacillus fastidiosus]MED4402119.1 hypothetical protein [Metabacillus fastidiosus]